MLVSFFIDGGMPGPYECGDGTHGGRACPARSKRARAKLNNAGVRRQLISINAISSIRVYRGGTTADVAVVNRVMEDSFLQDVGGGEYGFSRAIYLAEPSHIRETHAAFGGPELPPLDHDGLGDAFLEKASMIWYWHDSEWLQPTWAD